jgi:hypothetical protein
MARTITITFKDGSTHEYQNVPDNVAPDDVAQRASKEFGKDITHMDGGKTSSEFKPELSQDERVRSNFLSRLGFGAMEPMIGAGQLIAHGISAGEEPGTVLGDLAQTVDDYWKGEKAKQDEAKKAAGIDTDIAGFAGNVLSPMNALIAAKAPAVMANTVKEAAKYGTKIGGLAAATQPAYSDNYGVEKAAQIGTGAVMGGLSSGLMKKAGEAILKRLPQNGAANIDEIDNIIAQQFQNEPEEVVNNIRNQLLSGAESGKVFDPKAALRKAEFETLGIQPLTGQITRDPLLYSQERNMRGMVPEIADVLTKQGAAIRDKIGQYGTGASENYQAGNKVIDALAQFDESKRQNISSLYRQARESSGKDIEIPLQGLSQDYANILDKYQEKIPGGVKKKFEDLGLLTGKQLKVFNVEDADQLLKLINDHVGSDKATNNALTELRGAVKKSVMDMDSSGGVFAPAVKAAQERFQLHDALPALKAVADKNAEPDTFIKKFIINGKTNEVKELAKVLKDSPEAFSEARAKIGESLAKAAYGENMAGDAALSPERFAKFINNIGTEKLSAFFDKSEVDKLKALNNVSAYINKFPDANTVNTSNTATAILQNAKVLPGLKNNILVDIGKSGINALQRQQAINKSLAADVPFSKKDLSPVQKELLNKALLSTGVLSGISGGLLTQ